MSGFLHDIQFAIRTLRRNPGYTLTALLTLVIGIGATVAVFSVARAVLFAPLPFPRPDRLVSVAEENGNGAQLTVSWRDFLDWRDGQRTFEAIAAHCQGGPSTVLGLGKPVRVGVVDVSDGFFSTLGISPERGRTLLPDEHVLGGPAGVVVSDGFWRTYLGSDPEFADREIEVGGFHARVVGVMPPEFEYPEGVEIWAAIELNRQSESRSAHNFEVIGRLEANADIDQAHADLDAITATFLTEDPGVANEDWFEDFFPRGVHVEPMLDALVGDTRRPLLILLGASALVLLIACTNLASAMLARGIAREREFALRRSIGAGRFQLVRHVLVESLVLSVAGAALGVGVATLAVRALPALAPAGIPRMVHVRIDDAVVGVAVLTALMTALLFGLLPAVSLSKASSASVLRGGARGGHGRRRHRVWNTLVSIEVALALTLLIGAGLLLRSFWSVLDVRPGFATHEVLTATLNPPSSRYPDGEARRVFFDAVLRELESVRGPGRAGLISAPPMTGVTNGRVDIWDGAQQGITADYQVASNAYFDAIGLVLLHGRIFTAQDRPDGPHVVVVNKAFADLAWPGEDPLGKQMTGGGMDDFWDKDRWATVIGVVSNMRQRDLTHEPRPAFYFPYNQRPFRTWSMTIIARPDQGSAVSLGPAIRTAVDRVDSDVPVSLATIESRIDRSLAPRRFTMLILVFFAVAALGLACVGIWGVVAYAVARRTREIGIRMALGAEVASVRRLVQSTYLRAAALGAAAGLLLSLSLTRVLRSLLYNTGPDDPVTIISVIIALAVATWVASFIPAWRTARISPLETMRIE